ncbi:hypothetical protein ACVWZM_003392 [Bradyrhizobium sp. USDA 4501]
MRRSFSAVTISSVTRMLTRRWASRSTFGFHSANDPARRLLAASSVSWARLTASSADRAWRGMVTAPIETVTDTGPDLVGTTSSRTAARKRSAATLVSSTVQLRRIRPNLLPEKRPSMSPLRSRARIRFATSAMTASATSKPKASLTRAR